MPQEIASQENKIPLLVDKIAQEMKTGAPYSTLVAPAKQREEVIQQLTENLRDEGHIAQVTLHPDSSGNEIFRDLALALGAEEKIIEAYGGYLEFDQFQRQSYEAGKKVFIILDGLEQLKKDRAAKLWESIRHNLKNEPEIRKNTRWLLTAGRNIKLFKDDMPRPEPRFRKHFQLTEKRGPLGLF